VELAKNLVGDGGVTMMPQLVQLAVKARIAGTGMSRDVPMPGGRNRMEATVLPQADGTLLMLGRDSTLEASIRSALAESRTRFKDLVDLAADFAWETDADGSFTYISARGAIGFPPEALIGLRPREMLVDADGAPNRLPFDAIEPVRNVEAWLQAASGESCCLLISAAPIKASDGHHLGARGIAIDVTSERRQQTELAELKTRERLVQYILEALRGEVEPQQMLSSAARALARTTSAEGCVLRIHDRGDIVLEGRFGDLPDAADIDAACDRLMRDDAEREGSSADYRWLGNTGYHSGEPIGVMSVWRSQDSGDWGSEERRLLDAVEQHFAIAFRQIADQLQLERLSRTDELTGLSNRRAFFEDMGVSLLRCTRRDDNGALLYIDLDNFKPINDTLGHEAGDELLRKLGHCLLQGTRGYDLTARLGGDEFAVWLEGASTDLARRRAEQFVADIAALQGPTPKGAAPLGASVGIAMLRLENRASPTQKASHEGANEGPDAIGLLSQADQAMYQAKRKGKGRIQFFGDPA